MPLKKDSDNQARVDRDKSVFENQKEDVQRQLGIVLDKCSHYSTQDDLAEARIAAKDALAVLDNMEGGEWPNLPNRGKKGPCEKCWCWDPRHKMCDRRGHPTRAIDGCDDRSMAKIEEPEKAPCEDCGIIEVLTEYETSEGPSRLCEDCAVAGGMTDDFDEEKAIPKEVS